MNGRKKLLTNQCGCGCGELVRNRFKRGHFGRTPEGRVAIVAVIPDPFFCRDDKKRLTTVPHRYRKIRTADNSFHCDICGIKEWHGQTLSLVVDHIDGKRWNNLLENLRLVCPNCSSLLPTHAGRNKARKVTCQPEPRL